MAIIGYIRVSSKDQNLDRQKNKLINLGVEDRLIFEDKASGKDFNREQYKFMRNQVLRPGDLLYIDSLDRLGRNYDLIISEWKYITREINADIVVLDQESIFDSRKFKQQGDIGKLLEDQMLSLLAYVAETERKKIKQRQAEGIALAKSKGKTFGRPVLPFKNEYAPIYAKWQAGEITAVEAQKLTNLKRATFYKLAREHGYYC